MKSTNKRNPITSGQRKREIPRIKALTIKTLAIPLL
jgi:hypothetical protein